MTSRFIRTACLGAALLLLPTVAQAQGEGRAHGLYEAGSAAVAEGDYEGAYRYFTEAYELSHLPAFLFNIANAAERLRRDDEAVRLYRQYLEEVPEAANRTYVEGRIRALAPAVEEAPETTTTTTATTTTTTATTTTSSTTAGTGSTTTSTTTPHEEPVDTEPHETGETGHARPRDEEPAGGAASSGGGGDVTGWVVLGAGGAVAVVGAILLGVGMGNQSTVSSAPIGSSWADYQSTLDSGNTLAGAGGALLGVGVAAAVAGVVIAVTSGGGGGDSDVAVRVGPTGMSIEGTF